MEIFRKVAAREPCLSFTDDCTSFGLMRELGIQLAFTARSSAALIERFHGRKGCCTDPLDGDGGLKPGIASCP